MGVITQAAKAVRNSTSVIITAGAGMGVDSGLPDFRGNQGFWRAYPALRGYPFEEMANPHWFTEHPERAWGFYGHRLNLYRRTEPHQGFNVLRKWTGTRSCFIYTANVDGAFQKAGFSEDQIVECHGSIHHLQFVDTHHGSAIWSADNIEVVVDEEKVLAEHPLPSRDGHLLRPNILMFGDWGWLGDRASDQQRRLKNWVQEIDIGSCVVIEMGAGKVIPTTRYFSESLQSAGATLIRINPRDSDGPRGTISIARGARAALLEIDSRLED